MDVEAFIRRWIGSGGGERSNHPMFCTELCDLIGAPRPDPAGHDHERNDYVFERLVRGHDADEPTSHGRIDLYKRDCFILESKQARLPGGKKAVPVAAGTLSDEAIARGRRGVTKGWDALMVNARRQAERYVGMLDATHKAPPFLIVCDVGHVLEIYADFTGFGRAYRQFPDRKSFRIYLEDLRDKKVRDFLAAIWTDPHSLDPSRQSARVTSEIAGRLARVSKDLERRGHKPDEVAHFLMRCIFTMFADDVDLIPRGSFTRLLEDCVASPASFARMVEDLWTKMDDPDPRNRYYSAFQTEVRYFNGNFFSDSRAFSLQRSELEELLLAAKASWMEVDPAIFGTLLEQALDPVERRRLGAHFTPRAYVERLVDMTVMEPLRAEWGDVRTKVESAKDQDDDTKAVRIVKDFHRRLCNVQVLDPACGTGNFLYVSLELMKRLEGEVLETLAQLGVPENLGLDGTSIDPHQFHGLEVNPRAAAITELVLWIGYLQQHYRTRTGHPGEPILKGFRNINFGNKAKFDAVLTWDGFPLPSVEERYGERTEHLPNPRQPDWPEVDFIVGNPPFMGGKDMRERLGSSYAEALWAAHPDINPSSDLVLYWWDRAAELLGRKNSRLRRFGFVTTNSISQVFQRRVIERRLAGRPPISIIHAVPDHPWTKATKDSAAVRIAMTVAEAGEKPGTLATVAEESGLDTDDPHIVLKMTEGRINADLTCGPDLTRARPLLANRGVASRGVALHGSGFIVTPQKADQLGLGRREGLERHILLYRHGRDIAQRSRGLMVIDPYPLTQAQLRERFPEVYQHLLETVKPERERNNMKSRRENWHWFGATNEIYRSMTDGLDKFVVTPETSRHRIFSFLEGSTRADNKLVGFGSADAYMLAVLSSHIHCCWAAATGGWLGVGNDQVYIKSRCFDTFPFPRVSDEQRQLLRQAGEELDGVRKQVLADHADLTMTGLYNVLDKIRASTPLTGREEETKARGLVLILKEIHDTIDRIVAEAYGWPEDIAEQAVLANLLALNGQRVAEEGSGEIGWLRPDYQAPRYGRSSVARTEELELAPEPAPETGMPPWPSDRDDQTLAIGALLARTARAMDIPEIARSFRRSGSRRERRIEQALLTLTRYGHVSRLPDHRFIARRAA
jgi:hypothetical protein